MAPPLILGRNIIKHSVNKEIRVMNMLFDTVPTFKAKKGIEKIEIVKNPNTGKLFASTVAGNFKVQGSIDLRKTVKYMYESEALYDEGCLTNVAESDNVQGVL